MSIQSIGNYRLSQTLGSGSFGKVKLAEHIITGHQVAVKILNKEKVKTLKMDQKIRREIQIMKLFRHPHIIKLYEVIETETDILLIMEYVSGGELFEYIVSHGKMTEEKARRFFQQIIAAVEYCHKHMIVHRDLKPENLLLDAVNGSVKIADFGLSNVMEYGAFLKTSCGSPNYAAPEVISGKLYAGPEVDVWSCGVILYALLCARLPFDNDHIPTLFKKIRAGEYAEPAVSASCRDLIRRALCVDPLTRITIDEIRAHRWFVVDLPAYLARAPRDVARRSVLAVDPDVVSELQSALGHRNVSVAEIEQAVAAGAAADGSMDALAVAYHLIYDQKYSEDRSHGRTRAHTGGAAPGFGPAVSAGIRIDGARRGGADVDATASEADDDDSQSALLLATSPPMNLRLAPTFTDTNDDAPERPPSSGSTSVSSSLAAGTPFATTPGHSLFDAMRQPPTVVGNVAGSVPTPSTLDAHVGTAVAAALADDDTIFAQHHLWFLGKMSRLPPTTIMLEVYRVLKAAEFRWKSSSIFSVQCMRGDVRLSLQLYKVSQTKHLLDIKKIAGAQFEFFDACVALIESLQI